MGGWGNGQGREDVGDGKDGVRGRGREEGGPVGEGEWAVREGKRKGGRKSEVRFGVGGKIQKNR
jgi:hypothetical protein